MPRRTIHSATITLKLPFDLDASEEVTALRAAGIPVDAQGNAERGFLFVRFGEERGKQTNIFRWFAGGVGPDHRDFRTASRSREHSVARSGDVLNGRMPN